MPRVRDYGDGGIFRVPGSPFWYIQYYKDGRKIRESTKTTNKQEARLKLQTALGRDDVPGKSKLKFGALRDLLMQNYIAQGRKLVHRGADGKPYLCGMAHLNSFFDGRTASKITTDDIRAYIAHRQQADPMPANATINRELALLRRMLNLARHENKLIAVPHFPMLPEAPAREGFVDQEDFDKLLAALPIKYRAYALYLYTAAPRSGETKKLDWSQVNLQAGVIRIKETQTKTGKARTIPLSDQLLEALRQNPGKGKLFPVGNFRKSWIRACVSVGLGSLEPGPTNGGYGTYDGLTPHDLRRSGIRNMRKAGISEAVSMKISGHKTRAVFDRYNIIDDTDIIDAMSKRDAKCGSSLVQIVPAANIEYTVSINK